MDTMSNVAHYNVSYSLASNSATPFVFWLFMAVLGLILLFASFILKTEQGNDICAIMAPFPILITAWQSLSIDVIGGYGVAGILANDTVTKSSVDVMRTWVLMENHIIYSEVLISLFYGLLFIVSLLNIYRIWLNNKVIDSSEDTRRTVSPPERIR